jgi:hypothetical protein
MESKCNDLIKRYIQPITEKMDGVNGDFRGSTNLNVPEPPDEKMANFLQIDGMPGA